MTLMFVLRDYLYIHVTQNLRTKAVEIIAVCYYEYMLLINIKEEFWVPWCVLISLLGNSFIEFF